MILDQLLVFSQEQAVTGSVASDNNIDVQTVRDLGMGEPLHLGITVVQAPQAEGPATVQFRVQVADDATFSQNVNTTTQSDALTLDALAAGTTRFLCLQRGARGRFMRVYYEVGGGPLTAGQFSAYLVKDVQDAPVTYPSDVIVE